MGKQFDYNQQAKSILEQVDKLNTVAGARLLWSMATYCKDNTGNWEQALDSYREAKRIRELTNTMETIEGAWVLWGIADVSRMRNDLQDAFQMFVSVKLLLHRIGGLATPCGAWTHFSIAIIKL